MAKGAIVTLDLVFAFSIAILFIASLANISAPKYQNLARQRLAHDILEVLDEQNFLENQTTTTQRLKELLPTNIEAELKVDCYLHCTDIGEDCSQEFYKNSSFKTESNKDGAEKEKIVVKRFFIKQKTQTNYCIAKMKVWEK